MADINHGTITGYFSRGCRCDMCRRARAAYERSLQRKKALTQAAEVDRDLLSDLLHELFPEGLTEDCPARQTLAA